MHLVTDVHRCVQADGNAFIRPLRAGKGGESLLGLKFKYEISAKHSCVSSEIFYNEHNGGEDRQVAEQRSALLRGSPSGPSGFGLGWASSPARCA